MARPIWTGTLSFGLLNIPVLLMSGERRVDLHFRMLDARDNTPIRYERVNAETGEEVPWKDIVKAFEYDKGSYVVLEPEDIKSAAPESHEAVEVEAFVDAGVIPPQFFEKPYFLVPGKKAEKGYVLLRDTLRKTKKIGIARVVIRTREYLCAVMPQDDALLLMLLRYPQEIVEADSYTFPSGAASSYRISTAEFDMAEKLISSMAGKWKPEAYRDEFRDRLGKVIEKRMKANGVVSKDGEDEADAAEDAATNVVDFVALLEKSLAAKKRTPASSVAAKSIKPTAKSPRKAPAKATHKPAPKPASKKRAAAKPVGKTRKSA